MKKFVLLAIAILILQAIPEKPVLAADPVRRTLTVVTESWPPFRISDETNRYGFTGIDMDILALIEQELGVNFEVQRHPFARCLEMMKTGQADMTTGIAYTAERAAFIRYVPASYFTVGPVFYTQKGKGNQIRKYEDLYNYSVGFSLNSAYFEPFNSDTRMKKVGISTELQLIQMVALGRLDVTIGTNPNIAYDIKLHGLSDKLEQTAYVPDQKTEIFIGISLKSGAIDLTGKIDLFIRKIITNGEITRIAERYR